MQKYYIYSKQNCILKIMKQVFEGQWDSSILNQKNTAVSNPMIHSFTLQ